MKHQIKIKEINADNLTPVSVFLRLRHRFIDCKLLECADYTNNSKGQSIIACGELKSISVTNNTISKTNKNEIYHFPLNATIPNLIHEFFNEIVSNYNVFGLPDNVGLLGYFGYDCIKYFDKIKLNDKKIKSFHIPDLYFGLFAYYFVFDHQHDKLTIVQFADDYQISLEEIYAFICFESLENTTFNTIDYEYSVKDNFIESVNKAKHYCKIGDAFQVVLSRQFTQNYKGDDFNVYRKLRFVNPSPYMFYFDCVDYKLFGASPESHLIVNSNIAYINPIAGTVKRSGNEKKDEIAIIDLQSDKKENAEHDMLIDLARNDLSIYCNNVNVMNNKEIKKYSHVMHMVSTIKGNLKEKMNYSVLERTFPAGTLSGAPKFKAVEIIDELEHHQRGFYGGAVGILGFNENINLAIMIRSFLAQNSKLFYSAGAGITVNSIPENEMDEVNNKINALRAAINLANSTLN